MSPSAEDVPDAVAAYLPTTDPGRLVTVFADNTALEYGGAVACVACGAVVLYSMDMVGNTAAVGGGIHATAVPMSHGQVVVLSQSSFLDNKAVANSTRETNTRGGAAYLEGSFLLSSGSTYDGNRATLGSGIYWTVLPGIPLERLYDENGVMGLQS